MKKNRSPKYPPSLNRPKPNTEQPENEVQAPRSGHSFWARERKINFNLVGPMDLGALREGKVVSVALHQIMQGFLDQLR